MQILDWSLVISVSLGDINIGNRKKVKTHIGTRLFNIQKFYTRKQTPIYGNYKFSGGGHMWWVIMPYFFNYVHYLLFRIGNYSIVVMFWIYTLDNPTR